MEFTSHIEPTEKVDNLTVASGIINYCKYNVDLDVVKVAKAILLEMVGEDNA